MMSISKGDLFATFDVVRTVSQDGTTRDCKRFKILQDPNVLEDLDLEILASESRRAIDMAKDASDHNKDHNVAVIKKVPVIAIKYPMSGGQVKRFQIRFTTDSDFYEALKQFASVGVHMLEAGTFPSNRAQQMQQPFQRPTPPGMNSAHVNSTNLPAISAVDYRSTGVSEAAAPNEAFFTGAQVDGQRGYTRPLQYFQKSSENRSEQTSCMSAESLMPPPSGQHVRLDLNTSGVAAYSAFQQPVYIDQSPNIDLYTPRPSTAPAQISQHLSQVLPPPRELPFKLPARPACRKRALDNDREPSKQHDDANRPGAETIIPDSQEAIQPSPTKRNKASSSSQNAAAKGRAAEKKPRAPRKPAYRCDACKARGPRSRCRHKEFTPPLPSIEEVFDEDDAISQDAKVDTTIETQALLTRSAATKKREAPNAKPAPTAAKVSEQSYATRVTRSMSVAAAAAAASDNQHAVHKSIMADTASITTARHPCTPADQLLRQSTPPAPLPHVPANKPPQSPPAFSHPDAQPTQLQPSHNGRSHLTEDLTNSFSNILEHSSLFSDAKNKLITFAGCDERSRIKMLQDFLGPQMKMPEFKVLARVMEDMGGFAGI